MTIRETFWASPRTTSYWDQYTMKIGNRGSFIENAVTRSDRNSILRTVTVHPSGTPGYTSYLSKHLLLPENSYKLHIKDDSGTYYIGKYTQRLEFSNYTLTKHRTGNAITTGFDDDPGVNRDSEFANMDRDVVQKILSKLKDQKLNVAQFTAERSQLIRMVGDTAKKLASAITAIKKGNLRGAARALGSKNPGRASRHRINSLRKAGASSAELVSRTWLELQYGWLPLLSDIHGAAEAVANAKVGYQISRVAARKVREFDQSSPVMSMSVDGLLTGSSKCYTRRVSQMTLFFTVNETTKPLVALGLTNPAAIAWELLPWSFVIDWFIPIGDWINSLDATLGSSFVQGSTSISLEQKVRYTTNSRGNNGETFTSVRETRDFRFDRNTMLTFPSLQLPRFKNPVSPVHAANAIALLVQSIRK